MIPFDFEYYRPLSIQEAIATFHALQSQGKKVIYFSGGTEFITFSRIHQMSADAVIDIKGIPECNILEIQNDSLIVGAAVSLNKITESSLFPLLGNTVKQIADHTSRNKITIGGNINSRLIYREGLLPFLLSDAKVKVAGNEGDMELPVVDIFNKEMKLNPNQFLVQFMVDQHCLKLPFFRRKKTRHSQIGYPVISVAAQTENQKIRAAFSGVCDSPFRSIEIENILNDTAVSAEKRATAVLQAIPSPIVDDFLASAEYRAFVLQNTLLDMINTLEGSVS